MPAKIKKMKTLKRIQEYEKFEVNCQMIKEMEKGKRTSVSRDVLYRRNTIMVYEAQKTLKTYPRKKISNPERVSPCQCCPM
jgi:hypothetical protein